MSLSGSDPTLSEVPTVCPYCGVGCGVLAATDGERIIGVRGDPDHPANHGRLCTKGSTLHLTAGRYGRALYPELRERRGINRRRVSWDQAFDHLVERFASTIEQSGPDSVAFYLSGQLLTEDYHVFNKLSKGIIGTNNVDTNSRLCMSSAVAAYKVSLGADAPPCSYEDLDHADLVVIAGSNMAWTHPVLFQRLEAARASRPKMKVVVIDPRRTETAAAADLHLQILPGTDVALFNAVLHQLIWTDAVRKDFVAACTEGFPTVRDAVRECSTTWAARVCGVPEASISLLATMWQSAGAVLSLYCQGLNQSACGTDKNIALINLHLATAQIGRSGAGPFSLTGQPNAMGGREVGGLASLLPGHREVSDARHRDEIERLWGVPTGRIAAASGKPAVAMFDAVRNGEIRALWIVCTNPAQSMPHAGAIGEALERAECVVVQDAFTGSETARYADVFLPATTWGEKSGTVTNSERRVSRVRAVLPAPGEARSDWAIAAEFGKRLARRLGRDAGPMTYRDCEQVFAEHRAATVGRDLDIGGLSYARLETEGPLQWPAPTTASGGTARLYADGRFPTASGRARFLPTPYRPPVESVDARYPFALITGRLRDQWHSMMRSGRTPVLHGHEAEPLLHMNPEDAGRRGIAEGCLVGVTSRRGGLALRATLDRSLRSGQCYLPMHWGSRTLLASPHAGSNVATLPVTDPRSGQPELKHAAVRIERLIPGWVLAAFRAADDDHDAPLALADELRSCIASLPTKADGRDGVLHATVTMFPGRTPLVLVRLAATAPFAEAELARLDAQLGLDAASTLRYTDTRRTESRRILLDKGRVLAARLCGGSEVTAACDWLLGQAVTARDLRSLGVRLLALRPEGMAVQPNARILCNCFQLSEAAASEQLVRLTGSAADRLRALQATSRAGTNCGSCLPGLRSLAREVASDHRHAPAVVS